MSLENAFSSPYSENSDTSQQAIELTIPFLEEDGFIDYRKIVDAFSISSQFHCDFPNYKFTSRQFKKLRDYKKL